MSVAENPARRHGGRSRRVERLDPMLEIRRARILDAVVSVVSERGFAGTTVAAVCAHARVSRSTFCGLFDGLEECLLVVLDDSFQRVRMLICEAFAREESWREGVRGALAALLVLLDAEPALARVLLIEAPAAGPSARVHREGHLAGLTALTEAHWCAPAETHPHPLIPAGVMASLLGVLSTHLVTGAEEPLVVLLGPLMGLVVAPYLDRRGIARQVELGEAAARELLARRDRGEPRARAPALPELLGNPGAYRARQCLLQVAEHPGMSNRAVADAIGIASHTQISKLLGRLAGMGLLSKRCGAAGGPNSWQLTPRGAQVAATLRRARDDSGRNAYRPHGLRAAHEGFHANLNAHTGNTADRQRARVSHLDAQPTPLLDSHQ